MGVVGLSMMHEAQLRAAKNAMARSGESHASSEPPGQPDRPGVCP